MKLEQVSREEILRSVHLMMKESYGTVPLWAFVRDVCNIGANNGAAICRELGWNPDAKTQEPLPSHRQAKAGESP